MSDPDRIELRGLRVLAVCGALPEEQARAQPFEIDLDLEADLGEAASTDRLADTVDYGMVARAVAQVAAEERFTLVERMASRMADVVGNDARVSSVTVCVRKLRPPVALDMASAGVRITRRPAPVRRLPGG
ncbi:MAG: dihydroneopterin aldolase [Acidimicrobiales bacterium]